MLAALWSGLGTEFAKQWVARALTPAFLFWTVGGTLLWVTQGTNASSGGWLASFISDLEQVSTATPVVTLVCVLGALVLVTVSGLLVDRLTLPALRLLEGYWTRPRALRALLVRRRQKLRRENLRQVQQLRARRARGDLTVEEFSELSRLRGTQLADPKRLSQLDDRANAVTAEELADLAHRELLVRRCPRDERQVMPTRVGDTLRAGELHPGDKYGIDAVVCWIPLWLLLPETVQQEVAGARKALDDGVRVWLWGLLFLAWTPVSWWAAPIAVATVVVAYYVFVCNAASLFSDLVEAAFDLHRGLLYDALHLPKPASPATEQHDGARLTRLLWGGDDDPGIHYYYDAGEAPPG